MTLLLLSASRTFRVQAWLLALATLCPVAALATTARVDALGGAGDYFEDEAGVRRWCGSLGDYPGSITLDFGHFNIYHGYHDDTGRLVSGPALGLHHDLGGNRGTVGLYLHTVGADALTGSLYLDDLDDTFTLIYNRQVGTARVGLLYRQGSRETGGTADLIFPTRVRSERREWALGARLDLNEGAYVDLAGELRQTGEEMVVDGDPANPLSVDLESESGLALRGRLFLRLGERTALVPLAEYTAENRPVQPQALGYFPSIDGHLLRLGCGLNFFPDTDRFFFAAGEFQDGSTDYSYGGSLGSGLDPWTHDWQTLSLQAGWESRFLPWMTLRSSAGYRLVRGEGPLDEALGEEPGLDSDDLFFTLGTGIHLGAWDLDAALSQQEPRPYGGNWGLSFNEYRVTHLSVVVRLSF